MIYKKKNLYCLISKLQNLYLGLILQQQGIGVILETAFFSNKMSKNLPCHNLYNSPFIKIYNVCS